MNKKLAYHAFIVLECVLWGVGNTVTKIGLQSISPFYCLTIRFFLSFGLFVLFFFPILKKCSTELKKCIPISVMTAASFILSTLSLQFAPVTTAGLLMALSVVFTPILAILVHKTQPEKKIAGAVLLVLIGLYLICGISGENAFGVGELMALISSFCLAVTLTFSAKLVRTIEPVVLSTVQSGVTALISLSFSVMLEDFQSLYHVSASGWLSIFYLAAGCTFIAYLLQNIALKHISPVFASIAFCTEPVFTALSAYLMLGEQLSAFGYLGSVFIIMGMVVSSLPKRVPLTDFQG